MPKMQLFHQLDEKIAETFLADVICEVLCIYGFVNLHMHMYITNLLLFFCRDICETTPRTIAITIIGRMSGIFQQLLDNHNCVIWGIIWQFWAKPGLLLAAIQKQLTTKIISHFNLGISLTFFRWILMVYGGAGRTQSSKRKLRANPKNHFLCDTWPIFAKISLYFSPF